jgi:hypothetical protein
VITICVAATAVPLAVPDARTQSPFFRFACVPAACFVIAVFELSFTFELPVLVTVVVIVNVAPETAVIAPATEPETAVAAPPAPTATNPIAMQAATTVTAPLGRMCCITPVLLFRAQRPGCRLERSPENYLR